MKRMASMAVMGALLAVAGTPSAAQTAPSTPPVVGAGVGLGVGVFDDHPATSLELGIELRRGALELGLGGRLRWISGEGFRVQDWDARSEWATVLRYLRYQRAASGWAPGVAIAAGSLADIRLGYGNLVDNYTSGIDADRGRLGAQLKIAGDRWAIDTVVDDVVVPRIAGLHTQILVWPQVGLGATAAKDIAAGRSMAGIDASYRWGAMSPYLAIGWVQRGGAGAHAGVAVEVDGARANWSGAIEARVATNRYIPGWVGALYDVNRSQRDALARLGGRRGIGAAARLRVRVGDVADIAANYQVRRGLADRAHVRLVLPRYRSLQWAMWGAADIARRGQRAVAHELRGQLPRGWFVALEAARLYRSAAVGEAPGRDAVTTSAANDVALNPLWLVTLSVGNALSW